MTKINQVEQERHRLAQRIDDDILASLHVLQLQTETYRSALQKQPDASMALTVLSSLVQQLVLRTQYLRDHLHPTLLETLGLEPALERFANDLERVHGMSLTLELTRLQHRLPSEVEVVYFRSIQTLVEHAMITAGAVHLNINFTETNEHLTLHYSDDGRWMASGVQFLNLIHEDVEQVGGQFVRTLTDEHHLSVMIQTVHQLSNDLTKREREILQWVADGLSNKAIAKELHLSKRTISFHLDNVYTKLGVNTRTEAVMIGLQRGWIQNRAE